MSKNEAIILIHKNNLELEIWKYLNNYMEMRLKSTQEALQERDAIIKAINKINKNKNEAISSLCEIN